jgi:ABC-type nickel/cobalt efflux system permease component RcnA
MLTPHYSMYIIRSQHEDYTKRLSTCANAVQYAQGLAKGIHTHTHTHTHTYTHTHTHTHIDTHTQGLAKGMGPREQLAELDLALRQLVLGVIVLLLHCRYTVAALPL